MTEVTFTQTAIIPDKVVEDIWITAIEGGCNYWCESMLTAEDMSTQKALMAGLDVDVRAWDDDESYHLNKMRMVDGIVSFCQLRDISPLAFTKADWYDIVDLDADVADLIVQFAVFGEVIYG